MSLTGHLSLSENINLDKLGEYLINKGVIHENVRCSNCNNFMKFHKDSLIFACRKTHYLDLGDNRQLRRCNTVFGAGLGTWFGEIRVPINILFRLTTVFLLIPPPNHSIMLNEGKLSEMTAIKIKN